MLWLRKSKKGFTLIELMVVVAIIGVLVLLGLRTYGAQKERACNAIAKANASTIQTVIVGALGDKDIGSCSDVIGVLGAAAAVPLEGMVNPYDDENDLYVCAAGASWPTTGYDERGMVAIRVSETNIIEVNAIGKKGELLIVPYSLPATKY